MEFDKIIRERHSVRSFKNKKPHWKKVLSAIDSSLQGPFAGNINNLKFVVVEDKKTIKKIASHCQQTWISESSLLIVVCSNDTHIKRLYGKRGEIYSKQQAGASIQTIIFKLKDEGIDSCWVGEYSDEKIKQMLNIPKNLNLDAIIPTGYEDRKTSKQKKPVKKELGNMNLVYWDVWDNEERITIL